VAARDADIIGIMSSPIRDGASVPIPALGWKSEWVQQVVWTRQAAGERFQSLELSVVASLLVTDNRRRGAREVAERRGWDGVTVDAVLHMPALWIGTLDQISKDLRARRDRLGLSYFIFTDRDLESAAPLVERLSGT
jgi:hypothetical protein